MTKMRTAGVRCQTLEPICFSDGLPIDKGDWVCVSHWAMMRHETLFPIPLAPDAFRWLNRRTALTKSSEEWMIWGAGLIVWSNMASIAVA